MKQRRLLDFFISPQPGSPAAPCHCSQCTQWGSVQDHFHTMPSSTALPLPVLQETQGTTTAFSTGDSCHCLFFAERSHGEAPSPVFEATAPRSQQTALHRALCPGWPGYRLQLLNQCSTHRNGKGLKNKQQNKRTNKQVWPANKQTKNLPHAAHV